MTVLQGRSLKNFKRENVQLFQDNMIIVRDFYRKFKDVTIGPLSFEIERGKVTALLGSSGSGKSVFLNSLLGTTLNYNGSIFINGEERKKTNSVINNSNVGFYSQMDFSLYTISGYDFLLNMCNVMGIRKSVGKKRIEYWMKKFDIWSSKDKPLNSFSWGMKNRMNLILSFIKEPELLILDEPGANLDSTWRNRTYDILEEFKRDFDSTIVLTVHNIDEVYDIIDNFVILEKGVLLFAGTKENLNLYKKIKISLTESQNIDNVERLLNEYDILTFEVNKKNNTLVAGLKTTQNFDDIMLLLTSNGIKTHDVTVEHINIDSIKKALEDKITPHKPKYAALRIGDRKNFSPEEIRMRNKSALDDMAQPSNDDVDNIPTPNPVREQVTNITNTYYQQPDQYQQPINNYQFQQPEQKSVDYQQQLNMQRNLDAINSQIMANNQPRQTNEVDEILSFLTEMENKYNSIVDLEDLDKYKRDNGLERGIVNLQNNNSEFGELLARNRELENLLIKNSEFKNLQTQILNKENQTSDRLNILKEDLLQKTNDLKNYILQNRMSFDQQQQQQYMQQYQQPINNDIMLELRDLKNQLANRQNNNQMMPGGYYHNPQQQANYDIILELRDLKNQLANRQQTGYYDQSNLSQGYEMNQLKHDLREERSQMEKMRREFTFEKEMNEKLKTFEYELKRKDELKEINDLKNELQNSKRRR